MKILIVGPSDKNARGGVATVISGIRNSKFLNDKYEISFFSTYITGNIFVRIIYCLFAYLRFLFIFRKFDIIHIHTAAYGSAFRKSLYLKISKSAGKKVIVHIHSGKFFAFYDSLNDYNKDRIINFLRSADLVILLSDYWKKQFKTKYQLTNCVSINNGVDTKQYAAAFRNVEDCKMNFLLLSKLTKSKGVYDLIDAVQDVIKIKPEIKVYMAGDGEVEKVRNLVIEKNLSAYIEVVGWVNLQKKIDLLKNCATVILPSYYEGLPMSILEGMASGKIIISTTVGAIPEVVTTENGFLIKPGDINELTSAMIKCTEGGERISEISQNNIKKIENEFSIEKMHTQIAACYEDVYAN